MNIVMSWVPFIIATCPASINSCAAISEESTFLTFSHFQQFCHKQKRKQTQKRVKAKSFLYPNRLHISYISFFFCQQPLFCVRKTELINLDGVYAGEVIFQIGKVVLGPLPLPFFFFLKVISSNTLI